MSSNLIKHKFPIWLLLTGGIAYCLFMLGISWDQPLLDEYSFRQTQTAISVYWMLKGAPWIAYPTPVLGASWSIPFEFPFYQWIVAITAKSFPHLTLDQSGRLVSEAMFIACLWPIWRITSHHKDHKLIFWICAPLILFSPIYAFWSRAFLMESTALLFSIWFVAALLDFIEESSISGFFEMSVSATLAALIKITTFVGFSFAGAIIVIALILNNPKTIIKFNSFTKYFFILISVLISIICLWGWVHFSDILKFENVIGKFYTSESLTKWNFGTLGQRLSINLYKVIIERAPNEALGFGIIFPFILLFAMLKSENYDRLIALGLIALYCLPFFVFTNLHIVHHYYQYANSIFLVAATGYLIYMVYKRNPLIGKSILVITVLIEIFGFYRIYFPYLTNRNRLLQTSIATYIKKHTTPDQVIVGFGLSWSSEVPYYSERRALLIPDSLANDTLVQIDSHLLQYVGRMQIGAVVICPNSYSKSNTDSKAYNMLLSKLSVDKNPHTVGYCKIYN